MDLVIGGAYQGKLDFAREKYGLRDAEIFTCTEEAEPDRNARCVEHLERYVYYCVKNEIPVNAEFRSDAVLIADDVFCGVVPIDPTERAWREETGRFLGALSRKAESVYRLFCGLPLQLK